MSWSRIVNPIIREVIPIMLYAAVLIFLVSISLASKDTLIGAFGDIEQFIWQSNNLTEVIKNKSSILNNSFFGVPTPYAYSPTALLQSASFLALFNITKDIHFSYNLLLLGFLFLNFLSMYVVLRLLKLNKQAAGLGATVYLFAPATIMHSFGHISLFVTFLIPIYFYLLFQIKSEPQNTRHWLVLAILNAAFFWTHEYFGLFGAVMFTVFVILNVRRFTIKGILPKIVVWVILFVVLSFPIIKLNFDKTVFDMRNGITTVRRVEEGYSYSSSPANYIFPSDGNLIYKNLPKLFIHTNKFEHLNYLGLVNICVFLYSLYKLITNKDELLRLLKNFPILDSLKRELIFIFIAAVVFSFGPLLKMNESFVKLPLFLVYKFNLPILNQIRAWGRFGVFAFSINTLFSASVLNLVFKKYFKKQLILNLVVVIVLMGVVLDQFPLDYLPRHKMEIPKILYDIRSEPGSFYVLHLPLSTSAGALYNSTAQFLQFIHQKPIVNGYSSFPNPPFEQRVFNSPLSCLTYPQIKSKNFEDGCRRGEIAEFLTTVGVKYVVFEKTNHGITLSDDVITREKTTQLLSYLLDNKIVEEKFEDREFIFYKVISTDKLRHG